MGTILKWVDVVTQDFDRLNGAQSTYSDTLARAAVPYQALHYSITYTYRDGVRKRRCGETV